MIMHSFPKQKQIWVLSILKAGLIVIDILPLLKEGDYWSSQTKFLIHRNCQLVGQLGLTFAPQASNPVCPTVLQLICLNPSSSMLRAADTSRSCFVSQCVHLHIRSDSF